MINSGTCQQFKNGLSDRQMQVAELVAKGRINKQIARELRLTEGTVKEYIHRIFTITGVSNRVELALLWIGCLPEDASRKASWICH